MSTQDAAQLATDEARVRLVLQRELETISLYEQLARDAASPQTRTFFEHLAREEKEHVAEAIFVLRALDPDQRAHLAASISSEHFGPAATAAQQVDDLHLPADPGRAVYAVFSPQGPNAGQFTVGALKRRG